MKKTVLKVSLFIAITLLVSCGSEENNAINLVKDGYLNLDKSSPVGQVLENCDYLANPKWVYFKTKQGREVVEFHATITPMDKALDFSYKMVYFNRPPTLNNFIDKYKINYKVVIQFLLTGNDDFMVGANMFEIDCPQELYNMFDKNDQKRLFTETDAGILKRIYQNTMQAPLPHNLMRIEAKYRKLKS